MQSKRAGKLSSLIISIPVMLINLALGLLAAFFGFGLAALVLTVLFFVAFVARVWAHAAARGLELSLDCPVTGLYPGDECVFDITVKNNSPLIVIWAQLFIPLAKNLCLIPDNPEIPDLWEAAQLKDLGSSELSVGRERFSTLLWYEQRCKRLMWHAKRRGVYSVKNWSLQTGDGFGLMQLEWPVLEDRAFSVAVFPRRVRVNADSFLRNVWTMNTAKRGITDDPTVIRSTREYQPGDSSRSINWRMLARGQQLSVNLYEQIQPGSIHFIFDGESFAGPSPRLDDMEEALSILASLLEQLDGKISCGISFPRGAGCSPADVFNAPDLLSLLYPISAYNPMPEAKDEEAKIIMQQPAFNESLILHSLNNVSRCYYIACTADALTDRELLQRLDPAKTVILSFAAPKEIFGCKCLCLTDFMEARQ